jgi:hypothetical protein
MAGDTLPDKRIAEMNDTAAGMAAVPSLESEVFGIGLLAPLTAGRQDIAGSDLHLGGGLQHSS